MFKDHMHLRKELTENVEVYTSDGTLITKGTMTVKPNKAPFLELKDFYNIGKSDSETFRVCSHNGVWFTLLECAVYEHGRIYPKIIVKSDSHDGKFKQVKFVIRGLSQWFDNSEFTDWDDNKITKYLNTNKFSAAIKDETLGSITISSENWWKTDSKKGDLFTISQHTAICIEAKDNIFSCDSAIDYIHRIKNLLSILIGCSLTIDYCFDIQEKNKNSLYFVNFQDDTQQFEGQHDCLIPASYLFSEHRWETIFKNAFENNKSNFLNIWSRLTGLSDFSKFWEYELLACVSLTDRYASEYSSDNDDKISNNQFSKLKKHLKDSLKTYANENQGNKLNPKVIESIEKQIGVLRNTKFHSFQSCFEHTYNDMSDDFQTIINLSKEDFSHLKKLRDKIAHGDIPQPKFEGNLTHEMTLQSKLLVILYCWAFKDFGIAEKDYIRFLGNWLHPMIRSADLNRTALDKVIGHYKFLPLNKRDFTNAKAVSLSALVLEHSGKGKNYKLRKDLENVMKNWYTDRASDKKRNLEEYLTDHIDTKNIHSLCYVGSVYVENGDQSHQTQGICLLNPPNELVDNNRFWEYDENECKWHQPLKDIR